MSKTIALRVRFKSWYISFASSANNAGEITKFYVSWRTGTAMANFWKLLLQVNVVGARLASASF